MHEALRNIEQKSVQHCQLSFNLFTVIKFVLKGTIAPKTKTSLIKDNLLETSHLEALNGRRQRGLCYICSLTVTIENLLLNRFQIMLFIVNSGELLAFIC